MSNIWTAASEGDLLRVQHFIESGTNPNAPDDNSYTPMHASVSWSQTEVLSYLLEKGGNINLLDEDGETPLFLVENTEMARYVISKGGDPSIRNIEGTSAAQSLEEEYPHIALYLRSLTGEPHVRTITEDPSTTSSTSNSTEEDTLDESTDSLISKVKLIMEATERGELTADDSDVQLRLLVEEAVNGTVEQGRRIGEGMEVEGVDGAARERDEMEAEGEGEGKGKRRKDEPAR